RLKVRAQVDRGVDSNFATPPKRGAVEDRGTGGHEHLVFQGRTGNMGAWPDRAVIPDRTGMLGASPDHRVFHDDPVAPDPDGATSFADEAGAVQDALARSDRDGAAQGRIRRALTGDFACSTEDPAEFCQRSPAAEEPTGLTGSPPYLRGWA